jgi:predicted  nucleic acid-binding Zn-ribbon protein
MSIRHRVPTVFTLYMVDVLCCALGCVILLWFLKIHEAKQKSLEAIEQAKEASQTSAKLGRTQSTLSETEQRLQAAQKQAYEAERERDQVRQDLARATSRIAELGKTLASQSADAKERLTKKTKEYEALTREKSALEELLRGKESVVRETRRRADDLAERLQKEEARSKRLLAMTDLLPGLREEAQASKEKLTAAEGRALALEKELAGWKKDLAGAGRSLTEAERTMESLRGERKALQEQVSRARAAAENRFAGIELTGRRVVFLVDMSGSMELVDENTSAPDKWAGVRATLAKIMRSLPELEKFQVILFSDRVTYLLGSDQRWLDYDPATSEDRVARTLAAIKPRGNTDMYIAFEAAFRYRALGLDTIYVFSDGLPNIGAGLSPEAARTMKEDERSVILSKYIRKMLKSDWNADRAGQPKIRINTVGFFYESPDVGAFLWALARENNGSFVGMSKP